MSKNGNIVIKTVFLKLVDKLHKHDFRNNTVELQNVHLTFDPKEEYIDYGTVRPASRKYIQAELNWYLSKDKSIIGHELIETNPIWKNCATTEKGKVNSNYGNIVFAKIHFGVSQFDFAIKKLLQDKYTRQSLIIYTRPSLHWEYNDDKHAKSDFTCTTHTQHFITNDDKLEYIVNMRSNDSIYGLQNDYSWHRYVYFKMYNFLKRFYPNLKIGHIYWNVGSMHVYERHYELLDTIVNEYKEHKKCLKK